MFDKLSKNVDENKHSTIIKSSFNKVDVEHTRDIVIESEKNRDGECTIQDVRNALLTYSYTPSYLELRLSQYNKSSI